MMKNKISFLLLLLVAVFGFTACDDDEVEPFENAYRLALGGPDVASPGTSQTYTVGNVVNPEAYTWSVEGPAQIVGAATGATVTVQFQSVGEAIITATNGTDTGRITVQVGNVEPAVTAALKNKGALRSGESDTVFFEFDAPFSTMPTLALNTADSTGFNQGEEPFVSGSLGALTKGEDDQHYYAIYTAGEGNGTPEAKFANIIATDAYGADTVQSAYVQLYRVDNIAPVADLTYSQQKASSGTVVTVTATFSEAVMPADPADSLLFITISNVGTSERDTLMATDNPQVYTFEYEVGEGNGLVEVGLESIVDLAGNELAGVNNTSALVVDNTTPVITGTATDAGTAASIVVSSTESGTGMYVVMNAGSTKPANPEAFIAANGVASGSVQLTAGSAKTIAQAIAKGNYVVYFLAMDEAGNYSTITSDDLTMN